MPPDARVGLAVPAAGHGRRMGGRKKPYLELLGRPLLEYALAPFLRRSDVVAVRVALTPEDADDPPSWIGGGDDRVEVVPGGATRAESVREAIRALPAELDLIVVHDAARPLLDDATVQRCLTAAARGTGAVAGWPSTDTLKEVDDERRVVATPDRSKYWSAQTPQAFPATMVRNAYEALEEPVSVTDDASVVERMGERVIMVEGSPRNLKVTRPQDVALAELYLRAREADDEAPENEEDGP